MNLLRMLNRHRNEVYFDSGTGDEKRLGSQHTFMFVPFEYWAFVLLVANVWWIFSGVL